MSWTGGEFEFLTLYGPNELTGSSYFREVARGNVNGAELFHSVGEAIMGAAKTWFDIGPLGVADIPYPGDAGLEMTITSSSANDTDAGTGINSIRIHYLDANGDAQQTDITMNGTSDVVATGLNMRWIQCVHALTVGSGTVAAGNITVTNGGTTYAGISTGATRCSSSARMVPSGKKLFISSIYGGVTSGANAAGKIFFGSNSHNGNLLTYPLFIPEAEFILQETTTTFTHNGPPITYDELTVVKFKTTTDKAATVSASWMGWIENA